MSSRHHEPTVRFQSPMPKEGGYVFVPKGNVYITSNCRKQTQEAGQTVYTVLNAKNNAVGIRVPRRIRDAVQESHEATREKRAQAVLRKDEKLEREFRDAVLAQFPGTPEESVTKIVGRAMAKRSRRVGRTGKLDVKDRAALAVRAHIRHVHTDYDKLMRSGVARGQARSQIHEKIDEVVLAWGGETSRQRSQPKKEKRGQAKRPSKGTASRGKAAVATGQKPKRSIPTRSGRSRREKKLVVRRRSSTSVPSESPSPEPQAGSREPGRRKLGASLLDDGDSESDEFAWSISDLSLDEDDDDYDDEY